MPADLHGLELTTDSDDAAAAYGDCVRAYLGFKLDTGEHLKRTFAADGEMPMALITRGYFFHLFCLPGLEAKAVQSREQAEAAIAQRGATKREKWHLAALAAWNRGDMAAATDQWERILLEYPRDVLALRLSHYSHFYLHGGAAMRQSVGRIMHAWDEGVPDYGYVLGVCAFANEEAGDYAAAEAAGRRAVEINPGDIWATHAVAHVLEMQGRQREGIDWLDGLCGEWGDINNFRFHTWWHKAMYHLELGQHDAVLALYDGEYRAEPTEDYLDVTNATAMLWRLEYLGVDIGERWRELADVAERHSQDAILAFADAHYMMALAKDGRDAAAAQMLAALEQASTGQGSQAKVLAEVGLPVCRATLALAKGDDGSAADLLLPLRDRIWRLGGSHAQRDVWAQMLCRSVMGAGRNQEARALLAQRTAEKPNSPISWRWYAEALAACGDGAAAAEARGRADQLLSG
ncbi:MAG: tetratricopeptide repeat protein [Alphaproteobacteria bacterium]|nr:tetratricopeptide repeat protein [Alphaproteobacteria bacterium]MDP6813735.1 tetratricopeptide repeat protein [Alphaproteobacteria bacterium]